ncbi:ABC transporter ATP-binding protein [Roseobacter sp. N2S]|uniref:ABC transporter ATP-binding protein n=1 Tax=Roseobacter sp. N2S TaxID=2663844 RepID=UPI0028586848|nr:ABC transporter ATP-binding protein [Roseobacter sp. N2S]MDR6266624.1 peptide/nickel transport system ATP-binding protein [Roseobacter sp. N2S]
MMVQPIPVPEQESDTTPALDVQGLSVEFPTRRGVLTAIDEVSMQIAPGEILGVVGESGAGKSITGLAVLGLLEHPGRIAKGAIHVGGRRVDTLTEAELTKVRGREMGAIFQDPLTALNPLFTVGKQLVETIRLHNDMTRPQANERALELLRSVGIPAPEERLRQYPHQFSGGMRQRVVIALALAAGPRLIIADEPTTALDVSIQAQITALLRKLCDETGVGIMLVTHDMGVIAETADRVCVMYSGRVVESGPVKDVIHNPQHPYTKGLMAAIPSLHDRVEILSQIDGSMPRLNARPSGCAFHPRCPQAGPKCGVENPALKMVDTTSAACWLQQGGTR